MHTSLGGNKLTNAPRIKNVMNARPITVLQSISPNPTVDMVTMTK